MLKTQDSSPYSSWHGSCKSYRAGHDEGSNNRHQCRNDYLPRLVWLRPGAFGGGGGCTGEVVRANKDR